MQKITMALLVLLVLGCASNEAQIRDAIHKNPKIVFDVIEENPEQFIEVVNRVSRLAQQKQYEKQFSEMKKQQEEDLKNPKNPQLTPQRRLIGDDSAKIVLVEYADFQCPACSMAYAELKKFKEKYRGQVQFYYKNMPLDFHKMAYPAAAYFESIRLQDKVKAAKFYDYVFENQKTLSIDFLKKAVKHAGADLKKVEKDMKSPNVKKIIDEDMAEFQKFGFTGTPVIILNGVAMSGAQRLEDLERILQLTRKK